jgi:hypothetical protein
MTSFVKRSSDESFILHLEANYFLLQSNEIPRRSRDTQQSSLFLPQEHPNVPLQMLLRVRRSIQKVAAIFNLSNGMRMTQKFEIFQYVMRISSNL